MVAAQSAVMMNNVPTCSTGDLTTVTLTQGGQMSETGSHRRGEEQGDNNTAAAECYSAADKGRAACTPLLLPLTCLTLSLHLCLWALVGRRGAG